MRPGVRIGIDVGRARVGIAVCDPGGSLAVPVLTRARGQDDERAFRALIEEYEPIEIIVGLPVSLSGADTASTNDARAFATWLAGLSQVTVRLFDERLSTVSAQRALHDAGRSARSSRAVVDQAAAVIILQTALDSERSSGRPPGMVVEQNQGS